MKNKLFIIPAVLLIIAQSAAAQTPKWVERSKQAVFSVITYGKNDAMLRSGNGFFVSEDGIALSDYSLFRGAERAVVITASGKQMPVSLILGANDMYDVIKFKVDITEKKVPALTVASAAPAVGAEVWMLPYSTQKSIACESGKVKEVSTISGEYHYYTLSMPLKEKMVSCPVMDAYGKVFGIAQKSSGADTTSISYAIGVPFALSQTITALSFGDAALNGVHIRKALPDAEDQALVYLYMASTQLSPADYEQLLNDFIRLYPNNADGYVRRAALYLSMGIDDNAYFDKALSDYDQALKVSTKKDDVYYNMAKAVYTYRLTNPEKPYKDWTYETALNHIRQAVTLDPLPVYIQLEGDILFAMQNYAAALESYNKVNASNIASAASFYSAAKTKELLNADVKERLALMDSCVSRCPQPVTDAYAPYLLERAQLYLDDDQPRKAMSDYDNYYKAVNGQVNDVFYYYREQAAMKARQYQRAIDDIAKAIELNPTELSYQTEQAVINLRVARYDEAIGMLQQIIKEKPDYAKAYRLLGLCHIQKNENDSACKNFQKAKELGDAIVDDLIKKYCK